MVETLHHLIIEEEIEKRNVDNASLREEIMKRPPKFGVILPPSNEDLTVIAVLTHDKPRLGINMVIEAVTKEEMSMRLTSAGYLNTELRELMHLLHEKYGSREPWQGETPWLMEGFSTRSRQLSPEIRVVGRYPVANGPAYSGLSTAFVRKVPRLKNLGFPFTSQVLVRSSAAADYSPSYHYPLSERLNTESFSRIISENRFGLERFVEAAQANMKIAMQALPKLIVLGKYLLLYGWLPQYVPQKDPSYPL